MYSTDCINYYFYGVLMSLCQNYLESIGRSAFGVDLWTQGCTETLVTIWRTCNPSSRLDGGGVKAAVAFADAGYTDNWNCINQCGLPSATPDPAHFSGQLTWDAGASLVINPSGVLSGEPLVLVDPLISFEESAFGQTTYVDLRHPKTP